MAGEARGTRGEHVAGGEAGEWVVCAAWPGPGARRGKETAQKMPEMAKHPQGSGSCGAVLVSS